MTKWYNTNYHYIVPELQDATPTVTENRLVTLYKEAKDELGIEGKPVLIGPYSFLKLAKHYDLSQTEDWLKQLTVVYSQVLRELEEAGVLWVQLDEPSLVTNVTDEEMAYVKDIYETLHADVPNLQIIVQTYFDAVENYDQVVELPVAGIGLDFVHDGGKNLHAIQTKGFPGDKVLAAGVIDGRNIWKAKVVDKLALLEQVKQVVKTPEQLWIHLPQACFIRLLPYKMNQN